MTRYGIDSAALLLLVERQLPVAPGHTLVAPNRALPDLLGTLLADVRNGARTEKAALQLHTRATETKIRLLGDRVSRRTAWDLALEHGWELRDAEYLAVTKLQADALVTFDARLAGLAEGIVPAVGLDVLAVMGPGAMGA